MNQDCDAKTWIGAHLSHLFYKLGWVKYRKFRNQKGMTRDPYTNWITTTLWMGLPFSHVIIPWRLYTPEVWIGRKRLLKPHKEKYVNHQRYLRAKAITLNYER